MASKHVSTLRSANPIHNSWTQALWWRRETRCLKGFPGKYVPPWNRREPPSPPPKLDYMQIGSRLHKDFAAALVTTSSIYTIFVCVILIVVKQASKVAAVGVLECGIYTHTRAALGYTQNEIHMGKFRQVSSAESIAYCGERERVIRAYMCYMYVCLV